MPSNQQQIVYECGCCDSLCCEGRCNPYVDVSNPGDCTGAPGENPLPTTLTVEMTTDDATYGCFSGSTTVTSVANGRWGLGTINATCQWHDPTNSTNPFVTWYFCAKIAIQCTAGSGWLIELRRCSPETNPHPDFVPADSTLTKTSCDPILLEGTVCYTPGMSSVVFPTIPALPPIQHPTICLSFLVYETP